MSESAPRLPHLRAIQAPWRALAGALAVAVGFAIATSASALLLPGASSEAVFYANGLLNILVIIAAFAQQARLRDVRLPDPDPEGLFAVMARHNRRVLLPLGTGGLFAVMATAATAQWINILFLLPVAGFLLLFFPTKKRIIRWLRIEQGDDAG